MKLGKILLQGSATFKLGNIQKIMRFQNVPTIIIGNPKATWDTCNQRFRSHSLAKCTGMPETIFIAH